MITDLRDLEPRLGQYDPGLLFVGPVLSLPSSGYSYFCIAASGSKVYETVGLGFFENATDAESQRANIITILKSHFKEMLTFDSHYEMAHAVNARWPNEETVKVLTSAMLTAKPKANTLARDDSRDDSSRKRVVQNDDSQLFADDVTHEPMVVAAPSTPGGADDSADPVATGKHEHFGLDQDDIASAILRAFQRTDQPQSGTVSSSPYGAGDRPATLEQTHSGGSDADIAAVLRALRPSYQTQSAAKLPADTAIPLSGDRAIVEQQRIFGLEQNDIAAISKAIKSPNGPPSVVWLPTERARRSVSIVLLMLMVGSASALLTWAMVRSSTSRMAHEVGPTMATEPTVATASSSIPTEQTASIKPAQVEAAPNRATASLQGRTGAQGAAVPVAEIRQQPMSDARMLRVERAPAVTAPSPSTPQLSGRSTQVEAEPDSSPQPQAEAPALGEAAPDKATTSPPGRTGAQGAAAPIVETRQQTMSDAPMLQVERPPAVTASSRATPQLSGRSTQVEAVPDSSPQPQAEAGEPTQQVEQVKAPAPTSPPTPRPSGEEGIQTKTMPDTRPVLQTEVSEPTQQVKPPHSVASALATAASAPPPQPTPAPGSSTALHLDSQEISTLTDRGSAYLKRGDLASARLLLRRAAEAGSADAALMLGSTFDPLIIRQLGVIGIEPDVVRARIWYEKAAELGSDTASQRLATLKNQ